MAHHVRMIGAFLKASIQQDLAYGANALVSLLGSVLRLVTGLMGVLVLFGQTESVRGWSVDTTLAVLGVYLTVGALRDLFISPSLEALTGMDGEVWDGRFDFTLLRPVDIQFLASARHWRAFAALDLLLGMGVLEFATGQLGETMTVIHIAGFLAAMTAGMLTLYAIHLAFAALVFWSPGFLFTWVFNGLFQMARYPVGLYPGKLRLLLTWIIPVGVITTFPAQAITGDLSGGLLGGSLAFSIVLAGAASLFFRRSIRHYASASS